MSSAATPATDHATLDEISAGDAVSDAELGYNIAFGMLVGTPLTYLVAVLMCLAAGIGLVNSLSVAVLPCVMSGVFFGGVVPLSRQMGRHEHAEEAARREASSATRVVDAPPVAPAA